MCYLCVYGCRSIYYKMGSLSEISSLKENDSLCSSAKGQEFMSSISPFTLGFWLTWSDADLCMQSQSLWVHTCNGTDMSGKYCFAIEVCYLCFCNLYPCLPGWTLRLTDWIETAHMGEGNHLDSVPDPNINSMHSHTPTCNVRSSVCVSVGSIQMTLNWLVLGGEMT